MSPPTDDTPDALGSDSGLEQMGAPAAEPGTASSAAKTAGVDWEKRYNELHSFHGRQTNELGALRKMVEDLSGRLPKDQPKPPPAPADDAEARLFVHRLSTRPEQTLGDWFGKREESLKAAIREEYQKALQEQLGVRDEYIARQQIASLKQRNPDFDSLLELGVRKLVGYGVPMDEAIEYVRAANQGKIAAKKPAAPSTSAVPKAVASPAGSNGKKGAKTFREAWEQAGAEAED